MRRIIQAFLVLALLPLLISAGQPASAHPAPGLRQTTPRVQPCHYEAEITGTHVLPGGATIAVPIGRIPVPRSIERSFRSRFTSTTASEAPFSEVT